jgi:hypothetical protein
VVRRYCRVETRRREWSDDRTEWAAVVRHVDLPLFLAAFDFEVVGTRIVGPEGKLLTGVSRREHEEATGFENAGELRASRPPVTYVPERERTEDAVEGVGLERQRFAEVCLLE